MTGRFAQADSIVPGGVQGLDRYAYTRNNPVRFIDPSGHNEECGLGELGCQAGVYTPPRDQTGSLDRVLDDYGITTGEDDQALTREEKWAVLRMAFDIGRRFASVRGGSPRDAFVAVYTNGLTVVKSSQTCKEALNENCWASTEGNTITIYANANASNARAFRRMLIHEMGHVFDNTNGLALSQGYRDRIRRIEDEGWTPMPIGCAGLGFHEGNCNDDPYYIEQAADMFLGWVDGLFDTTSTDGTRRANWANLWIGTLALHGYGPSDYGINCDEDTGAGCRPQ